MTITAGTALESMIEWRAAAIASLEEALPMFGAEAIEILAEDPRPGDGDAVGAHIDLDCDRHIVRLSLVCAADALDALAGLLLGAPFDGEHFAENEAHDAVREIVNILAGGVKTRLLRHHRRLLLGLPFFVGGRLAPEPSAERTAALVRVGALTARVELERRPHTAERLRMIELERALADQAEQLSSIMTAAVDGIVVVRTNGSLESMNPAADRVFAREASIASLGIADLLPQWTELPQADAPMAHPVQTLGRRCDGRTFPIECSIATFHSGNQLLRAVILRDISQRLRLERELRQSQKHEAMGRLAGGLAHEMNTPAQFAADGVQFLKESFQDLLALIVQYRAAIAMLDDGDGQVQGLDDLRRRLAVAEQAADLEFLQTAVPEAADRTHGGIARIAALVAALRAQADAGAACHGPIDLHAVVADALLLCENECRSLRVHTALGQVPPVLGDRVDLGQALSQLLRNAALAVAGRDGGSIEIATRVDGDHVVLTVTDNGCGIPADIRDQVFDPFFTTREVGQGQGQGLTLARATVVDRHSGEITFDSEVGRGTTFAVRLPVGERT